MSDSRALKLPLGDMVTATHAAVRGAVALQQQMELQWTERLLADRQKPRKAKTEYDVLRRYDDEVPSAHRDKGE